MSYFIEKVQYHSPEIVVNKKKYSFDLDVLFFMLFYIILAYLAVQVQIVNFKFKALLPRTLYLLFVNLLTKLTFKYHCIEFLSEQL